MATFAIFFHQKIKGHAQFPILKVQKFDPKLNYFYFFFCPTHLNSRNSQWVSNLDFVRLCPNGEGLYGIQALVLGVCFKWQGSHQKVCLEALYFYC